MSSCFAAGYSDVTAQCLPAAAWSPVRRRTLRSAALKMSFTKHRGLQVATSGSVAIVQLLLPVTCSLQGGVGCPLWLVFAAACPLQLPKRKNRKCLEKRLKNYEERRKQVTDEDKVADTFLVIQVMSIKLKNLKDTCCYSMT